MDNVSIRSNRTVDYANLTRFTDDDESRIEDRAFDPTLLIQNAHSVNLLHSALDFVIEGRFSEAVDTFNSCLEFARGGYSRSEKELLVSMIHCSIAMCHYYEHNLDEMEASLKKASEELNFPDHRASDQQKFMYVRILCNYLVLFLKLKDMANIQKVIGLMRQLIETEGNSQTRSAYATLIVGILFRTDSLAKFEGDYYGLMSQFVSPRSFGVNMLVTAIRFKLGEKHEAAEKVLFSALEYWQAKKDTIMILLVLYLLITLTKSTERDAERIQSYFVEMIKDSNINSNDLESLVGEFEIRLEIAEDMAKFIFAVETHTQNEAEKLREQNSVVFFKIAAKVYLRQALLIANRHLKDLQGAKEPSRSQIQGLVNSRQHGLPTGMDVSRKLQFGSINFGMPGNNRLSNTRQNHRFIEPSENSALFERENLIPNRKNSHSITPGQNIGNEVTSKTKYYQASIESLTRTIELLSKVDSQSIANVMASNQYFRNAKQKIKDAIECIRCTMAKIAYYEPFEVLKRAGSNRYSTMGSSKRPTLLLKSPERSISLLNPSSFTSGKLRRVESDELSKNLLSIKAKTFVQHGDYVQKLNMTTNRGLKKFMKVVGTNIIRWGKNETSLREIKTCHSCWLSDVQGVLYGKCTENFQKPEYRKYEAWLCFSIILPNRPVDIYVSEDRINLWYIGLSEIVRFQNKKSYCLNKGKFFWRKLAMLLKYFVLFSVYSKPSKKINPRLSVCQAIILYGDYMRQKARQEEY